MPNFGWVWIIGLLIGFIVLWILFGGKEYQTDIRSIIGQMLKISPSPSVSPSPSRLKVEEKRKKEPSKGEKMVCQALSEIYGVPFANVRPKFMINPETNKRIEFDCYNEDLKIAGEYNGVHHYVWPNWTKKSYQKFIEQMRRDQLKVELSDRNGVYLITVPYNVPNHLIKQYVQYYTPENQIRLMEERSR